MRCDRRTQPVPEMGERRIEGGVPLREHLERGQGRACLRRSELEHDAIGKLGVERVEGAFGHVGLPERVRVMARVSQQREFGCEEGSVIGEHEFALRDVKRGAMSKFIPIAQVTDIAPGESRAYVVGDREIALFNVGGAFHAIENACPHQGGPLAEGFITGRVVTCPWHAWCFDVTSGAMTLGGYTSVDAFDVRLDGTAIAVSSEPRL